MMKEVWHEIQGLPAPKRENMPWDGPTEVRIEELKKKLDAFREKAKKDKEDYEAKMKPVVKE